MTESPHRLAWRVTEPLHAMVYFVPEAPERYGRYGIDPLAGYFASRGAAFGPAGPGLVAATFYNFSPALVARALPAVWEKVTPTQMIEARLDVADAALTRGLGADVLAGPEVAEAARLARTAAEAAAELPHGRPLFAAHADLPWPEQPHLVLFHAQMLLREFRGDGHVAVLLDAGVSGLEAIVLHAASGEIDPRFLQKTRGWGREAWATAAEALRGRGLLESATPPSQSPADPDGAPQDSASQDSASQGSAPQSSVGQGLSGQSLSDQGSAGQGGRAGERLSDEGRRLRAAIEERTDQLAEPAYRVLGEEGCLRLAELTRPLSRTIAKGGLLDPKALIGARRS